MIKVKDGYAKLINTSYTGDISLVLLSNGGTIGYDVSTNTILATIGSNVASADKLKNKVKLWGLDFDGSSDVNGDMTSVGNITITSSDNIDRFITFDTTGTHNWRIGYLGTGSDDANYLAFQSTKTLTAADGWHDMLKIGCKTGNAILTGLLTAKNFISGDGINDFSAGTVKLNVLNIPTSGGGTTFGPGSNGQVLKSNGTTVYWASDNNTTYAVYGKTINDSYKTAYRTLTKGNTTNGYYISAIRCDTASVDRAPLYGSGIAFGMADTHGYLYMSYSSAKAYIGAGNADKLNWTATLLHSTNSSVSGGGSSWGSSITVKINDTTATLTIPSNPNTDYLVKQSATTTSNYRAILLGTTNNSDSTKLDDSDVTGQAYVTEKLYFQPSTGNLGIRGSITSPLTTTTYLNGNSGTAIINSTAAAGYNMLAKMNSTNGVFTIGAYNAAFNLYYTAKTTINAGTNSITKGATLLDESGNSSFPGTVTAGKFTGNLNHTLTFSVGAFTTKTYNNNAAVTVNIPTNTSHLTNDSGFITGGPYLPLAGGTITGTLTIKRAASVIKYIHTDNTVYGYLGFNAKDIPVAYMGDGSTVYNLLHSGNSSVADGGSTWGSKITVKINGTTKTLTIPENPNTDYRVTQSETTTSSYRPLVVGYTSVSTAGSGMTGSVTNQVYVSNNFYVQPSTGTLYTTRVSATTYVSNTYSVLGYCGADGDWTGGTASSLIVGSNISTIIRSSGDDLYHYNWSAGARYKILDSNNSSVSGGGSSWGSSITVKINGTSKTLTIPSNPNTDTKVTLTVTSSNASYPLLLAPNGQTATTTTSAYFDSGVTLNPNTNTITANISGSAARLHSNSAKNVGGLTYNYAGGITSSTDATGAFAGPSTSTIYSSVLRLLSHTTSGGLYYRDLIFDVNGDSIWSRRVTNSGTPSLVSILHSGNSSVSGGGSSWGSSITVNIGGTSKTLTIPANPNTHWTTRIYAGASGTAANAAATNPYLKVTDDNTYRNLVRFVGGGATTVSSDASGNITISSTNTTYSFAAKGSATQGIYLSGTNTFATMTYSLKATVNAGTADKLAYYSGANAISAYTSTVGSSVLPIYLNAGVPTACDVPMVRYWARYAVTLGASGYCGYIKYGGNHNFITAITYSSKGEVNLTCSIPSGWSSYQTMIFGNGFTRTSSSGSTVTDTTIYPTIYITSNFTGSGTVTLYAANDSSADYGTVWLHFLCIS